MPLDELTDIQDLKIPPSSFVDLSSHAGQLTRMIQDVLGDTLHPSAEGPGVLGQGKRRYIMVEPSKEALNRDADDTFTCEVVDVCLLTE